MIPQGDPPDDDEKNGGGYRKPPRTTRFAKGQSGYPAGRPPGRHREAPYEAVLGQMVTIREGGVERDVKADEAFLLQHTTCSARLYRPIALASQDPGGTSIRNFLKTTPGNVDFCQNQWVLPPILRRIFAHMYWAECGRDRPQMTARNRKTGPAEKPEYLRTPREAAALDKFRNGQSERAPIVKAVKRKVP